LTGFLVSDNVTATYTRTAGETVAGSPYTISATLNAASGVLDNYEVTYNTASFTINKKTASVTPTANSKTYGSADPNPLTTGSLTGFLVSDNVTATYTRTAGETVAGGPYTISATLNAAEGVLNNYTVTYNTASFTINKKTASVTPNANNKTYGSADPNPLTTGSLTGFLVSDNVTATYTRTAGETVTGGPYTISATLNAASGVLENYAVTYNTASFTINKKTASVTPNANSKTYGSADPTPLTTGSLTGFLVSDNVTATYTRTAGETVAGGPYTISATLNAASGVLNNYEIAYNTASFAINKKTASVTPTANSKTYGSNDPSLGGSLSGFLAADNVTATYSRTPGETVAGSPYSISAVLNATSAVLDNYEVAYNTASFTINKKTASVTPTANSKTYGSNDPSLGGSLSGFLAADNVTATYSRTPGETVAGSPYSISATLNAADGVLNNYTVTYNTAIFAINRKAASVTPNPNSKTFGAADPSPITTGELSGFLVADNVTATYTRTAGETVAGSPYTISATLNAAAGVLNNYTVTYNTASFTITPSSITVKANDVITNNGEPAAWSSTNTTSAPWTPPTFTYYSTQSVTTIVYEIWNTSSRIARVTSSGVSPSNFWNTVAAGTYRIIPVATGISNYTFTPLEGTLHINPYGNTVKAVKPNLDCVSVGPVLNGIQTFYANYSWTNSNSAEVRIPRSIPDNYIQAPDDAIISGLVPQVFPPGTGKFSIQFDGSKTITWILASFEKRQKTSSASIASSTSNKCGSNTGLVPYDPITSRKTSTTSDFMASFQDKVYPNPFTSRVVIETDLTGVSEKDIKVFDVTGREYRANSIRMISAKKAELDLSHLINGQYYIRVNTKAGQKVFRILRN
jgi:hypothetical protein